MTPTKEVNPRITNPYLYPDPAGGGHGLTLEGTLSPVSRYAGVRGHELSNESAAGLDGCGTPNRN